jgi:multidrug efflux pump subunit AcrA (membrane-fusion protein)
VVDPKSHEVSLRPITIGRYAEDRIVVSGGLAPGARVVSGGVQLLRPGQKVDLVEGATP